MPDAQTLNNFPAFWQQFGIENQSVYVARDAEEQVLYVGMTHNVRQRMKQHFQESEWSKKATSLEVRDGFTLEEARFEENRLIETLKPIHNKQVPFTKSKPRKRRSGQATKATARTDQKLSGDHRREMLLRALAGEKQNAARHGIRDLSGKALPAIR
jgi:hypothetical protein